MIRRKEEDRLACPQGATAPGEEVYASVLRKVFHRVQQRANVLHQDSHQADVALEELLSQPLSRRYLLVRNCSRYRSWFLGHRLLRFSEEQWFTSPREALEAADLVRFAAHHLYPSEGEGITEDLRARAWAYRGNCLRILGDPIGAEAAFEVARRCRLRGTGDAMLEARLADLEASLRSAQGLYGDALSLLRRALAVYTRAGDLHQQGRNLVGQGKVQLDRGNFSAAEWLLRRGLRWIDAGQEPRLALVANHNLVCCALALGDLGRARALLKACRADYRLEEGQTLEAHRSHLEGKLREALKEVSTVPGGRLSADSEQGEAPYSAGRSSAPLLVGVDTV